jgi:hypothetical protein
MIMIENNNIFYNFNSYSITQSMLHLTNNLIQNMYNFSLPFRLISHHFSILRL